MTHILQTDRLILRPFTLDDAEAVFHMHCDPEVLRYTGEPPPAGTEEVRQMLVERAMTDYQRYGFGRWACVLLETGELVGGAGLKYLPELGEVDIGYRLRRDCWGRGLATEASRACVVYGFRSLGLSRIIGLVEPANVASIRVLEKIGFHRDDKVEYRGQSVVRYLCIDCPTTQSDDKRTAR